MSNLTVPYSTTEDESQWCGNIWRSREFIGGPWGFAWEVVPPYSEFSTESGWQSTQEAAEHAMHSALELCKKGGAT